MTTDVVPAVTFKTEALNVILAEVQRMLKRDMGYTNLVFETAGKGITVCYSSGISLDEQPQRYLQEHWSLLDLAMPLVSAMGYHRTGKMLGFYTQPSRSVNRWLLDIVPLGEGTVSFFVDSLQKVDAAYLLFFNNSLVIPKASSTPQCEVCGSPMSPMDGGDGWWCEPCNAPIVVDE